MKSIFQKYIEICLYAFQTMPNDCWNHLTITCDNPDELTELILNEIKDHHQSVIRKRGEKGVIMRTWSPWAPDFVWLSQLLDKYPDCWIKNEWDEEGGMAGVWVGYVSKDEKIIKQMDWVDLCLEEKHFLFL
jgi:hypothetical protein